MLLTSGAAEAWQAASGADPIQILGFRREQHGGSIHLVIACSAPVDYNYQSSDALSVRLELLGVDPAGVSAPTQAWATEVDAVSLSGGEAQGPQAAVLELHLRTLAPFRVRSAGNELSVIINPTPLAAVVRATVPVASAAAPGTPQPLSEPETDPASASETSPEPASAPAPESPMPPLIGTSLGPDTASALDETTPEPETAPTHGDAAPERDAAAPLAENTFEPEPMPTLEDPAPEPDPADVRPDAGVEPAGEGAAVEPEPAMPDLPFEPPPDPRAPPPAEPSGVEAAEPAETADVRGARATRIFEASREDREGWLAIRIATDGVPDYAAFLTEDQPHRLVLDVVGTESRPLFSALPVEVGPVDRVRIGQHAAEPEPVVRIIFDLAERVPHRIETDSGGMIVIFPGISATTTDP